MKFLIGCFFMAFLGCVYSYSYAQTNSPSVKGKVLTENNNTADGAAVTLLKYADSSIVKSIICTETGYFEFNNLKPGNYMVLVHKVGYKRFYSTKYILDANMAINIGEIYLQQLNNQLKEVTITDRRDYIEVKPDRTILNVERSILAAGNSAFDILSTAPGVRIIDNQVLFKGGQKALIAINGKVIGALSDEQLSDLLKSYQSSMISRIELMENPPAQYDAAGGGGVINIILKSNKETGFRANIVESAAFGQDYKYLTGLNVNYRTRKLNFFGSYSYADNKTPRTLDIDRVIGDQDFDLSYISTTTLKNHNFNFGTDLSISPNQTIGALVYGYHNQLGIDKHNITNMETYGVSDSNITEKSHIKRGITNVNYNLNYKGSFGRKNKTTLSADIDYSTYDRVSHELLENDFNLANGQPYRDVLYYMDTSPSNINVRSEKVDFSQMLSKTGTLSAGLKNSEVNSNNRIDFDQLIVDSNKFVAVPSLTDHFIYVEKINAGYVNYTDKFNNTALAIGLRVEQTNSSGRSYHPERITNRNYFDFFPNVQIIQTINQDNQFAINYNRRVTRPNYQDLNPFVAYIDEYSYSTGNPFLKPEYGNNYSISELYKNKFKVTLGMTITQNFIAPIFQQDDQTKIYTTTSSNLGTNYVYEAEFNIPANITYWWRANLYLDAAYARYVYNSGSASKAAYSSEIKLTQNFILTNSLRAELYGSYDSPDYYGIKQYTSQSLASFGISQAILHNNGSIKLAVSDIFNSDIYKYTSHYLNLDLAGREKSGTRFVTATFSYSFGNQTVKGASKRTGGNVDEQERLGGSSNEN